MSAEELPSSPPAQSLRIAFDSISRADCIWKPCGVRCAYTTRHPGKYKGRIASLLADTTCRTLRSASVNSHICHGSPAAFFPANNTLPPSKETLASALAAKSATNGCACRRESAATARLSESALRRAMPREAHTLAQPLRSHPNQSIVRWKARTHTSPSATCSRSQPQRP